MFARISAKQKQQTKKEQEKVRKKPTTDNGRMYLLFVKYQ